MYSNLHPALLYMWFLWTITLFGSVRCAADSSAEGFLYPAPGNSSNTDPAFTVQINDTMLVEYVPLQDANDIALVVACWYDNNTDFAPVTDPYYFSNTGLAKFDFNISWGSDTDPCVLQLYNATITECHWGPWGLIDLTSVYSSGVVLYSSGVFDLSGTSDDDTSVKTLSPTTTVTATTAEASTWLTCPPSGVPASAITPTPSQIAMIPKLAEGVTF